jgi:hypothetical protein
MKRIPVYLLLLLACSCSPSHRNDVYSEWSFRCRRTGEYIGEEKGRVCFGKKPVSDSYLWITEAAGPESIKIRNRASGHYLQMDEDGRVTCRPAGEADSGSKSTWRCEGFSYRERRNCGWYSLSNPESNMHLAQIDGKPEAAPLDRLSDLRAHWSITREEGSPLPFRITPDGVEEASFLGLRTAVATSGSRLESDYHEKGNHWTLKENISDFPEFTADNNRLIVALYNLALEETLLDIRTDSTFMAGKLWPDTWTRDAVYSIYFAYSWILPHVSKKTLLKQTLDRPGEALQDTGTGGSWPISTDRVVWALAAWEYYLASGDTAWLANAYESLSYTAEKDLHVAFDPHIGLFRGETCSMDWRTHTYPNWFSNENIGESFSCGTNALHLFLYGFLSRAGDILGKPSAETSRWEEYHSLVKTGLNTHFFDRERGVYMAYLYPRWMGCRAAPRAGIMSNGLCALLGAASPEQAARVVENFPLYPYGGAVLYPTIPDDYAYHNKSIWAVWQTPYMYAAKKAGNMEATAHIVKSQIRQGAMFLTHKENMTHDTGYDRNTALNSDRQLWSVASYISIVYRILFGMEMTETGLRFSPVVPGDLTGGNLYLKNFRYRDATVNLTVSGAGNRVRSLRVNGENRPADWTLPACSKGVFDIEIRMTADAGASWTIHAVDAGPDKCWSPEEPVLKSERGCLVWDEKPGLTYRICSAQGDETARPPFDLRDRPNGFYSVRAIDGKGFSSDLSRPVLHSSHTEIYSAAADGIPHIEDLSERHRPVTFSIRVASGGDHAIAIAGSNGHGPHDVYCYIRSVFVDGKDAGTFILESSGDWDCITTSNHIILKDLPAGLHTVQLRWNPEGKGYDSNMSRAGGEKNDARIRHLQVVRL